MKSFTWKTVFEDLTGYPPFPWQERLYARLLDGNPPNYADIPTGLGKTMVIVLWLIAYVEQYATNSEKSRRLPRRLIYIVDRRTVVDQATEVVRGIIKRLAAPDKMIANGEKPVKNNADFEAFRDSLLELCNLSVEDASREAPSFFGLGMLRGDLTDEQKERRFDWIEDPTRPAIVVSTIDMAGSKLLFSGYGDGKRMRPLHAALVGCDALLVHDEAHLTPAFGTLLNAIASAQFQAKADPLAECVPAFRVMELSATLRDEAETDNESTSQTGPDSNLIALDHKDESNGIIRKRLHAPKTLHLHLLEKGGTVEVRNKILEKASEHTKGRIVVFVQSPKEAQTIALRLKEIFNGKKDEKGKFVSLLTGRIRGKERDDLLLKPEMRPFLGKTMETIPAVSHTPAGQHFLPGLQEERPAIRQDFPEPSTHPYFLVATSAAEVGLDLHADHYVGDLTPLDSMIQRLGRVNRFGNCDDSRVDIVCENEITPPKTEPEYQLARAATLRLFKQIDDVDDGGDRDLSPAALRKFRTETAAFAPKPEEEKLTSVLLDFWAMTTLDKKPAAGPSVDRWLKGDAYSKPQTTIAWRAEVDLLCEKYANDRAKDRKGNEEGTRFRRITDDDCEAWFRECPLSTKECLQMPTEELVFDVSKTDSWAKRYADRDAIVLFPNGNAERHKIRDLNQGVFKSQIKVDLEWATLILPTSLGGLTAEGTFAPPEKGLGNKIEENGDTPDLADGEAPVLPPKKMEGFMPEDMLDVCDVPRYLLEENDEALSCKPFKSKALSDPPQIDFEDGEAAKDAVRRLARKSSPKLLKSLLAYNSEDNDTSDSDEQQKSVYLLAFRKQSKIPSKGHKQSRAPVGLNAHEKATKQYMERFVERLGVPDPLKEALILAAEYHDEGKAAPIWQTAAGAPTQTEDGKTPPVLAKSYNGQFNSKHLDGYRHEFGSLAEIAKKKEIANHPERDLILHLIAAHHGWSRPHFEPRALGPYRDDPVYTEFSHEMREIYIEQQGRFGWWGLAWLETLLRRADGLASAREDMEGEES